jgi:hypothetical protein
MHRINIGTIIRWFLIRDGILPKASPHFITSGLSCIFSSIQNIFCNLQKKNVYECSKNTKISVVVTPSICILGGEPVFLPANIKKAPSNRPRLPSSEDLYIHLSRIRLSGLFNLKLN